MAEKDNQVQEQRSKISFNAVKVALLLALVCIGINTYVLWSIYGSDNYSPDPIEVSVDKLASQIDNQITRIEQKILNIELSLNETLADQQLFDEIVPNLEILDTLQLTLGDVESSILMQEQILVQIEQSLTAILDQIDQEQFNLEARITVVEELLRAQNEDHQLKDSDVTLVRVFVERGDSIWSLASQYENPPDNQLIKDIMELNDISDPKRLHVGQELAIPFN